MLAFQNHYLAFQSLYVVIVSHEFFSEKKDSKELVKKDLACKNSEYLLYLSLGYCVAIDSYISLPSRCSTRIWFK